MSRAGIAGPIADLIRTYPLRSVAIIAFLLLSGLAEGVGIMTLLPLIDLATSGGVGTGSTLGRWTLEAFALVSASPTIGGMLVLVVVGVSLKAVFTLIAMKEVGYAVAHVMTDLRLQLIRALLHARWRYFVSQPVGALGNAISSEAVRAAQVYHSAALMIALVIQALVYAGLVLAVSWRISLAGVIAGALMIYFFRGFIAGTRRAGEQQTDLLRSLTSRLTDALQGIKQVKAMAHEKELLPLLEMETRGLNEAQQRYIWNFEVLRVLQEPVAAAIVAAGLYVILRYNPEPMASLMMLVFLFYRLLSRVHAIQQAYQNVAAGESAYRSLRSSISKAESERESDSGRQVPIDGFREIRLDHVRFAHGETPVLHDLSLSLHKGDFVAIVGASGSGKTTLADLLVRLIDPQGGAVVVDGVSLDELGLTAWRQQIGYVPQELLLFHDTVYTNVSLGDPSISREDAAAALRLAGVWDFIATLPQGLDTVVGERGARLSGGQRQRISLARALARKPLLLILDEVTAALDAKTEEEICATLRSIAGQVTILAVSHQPALLRAAHRAYRMLEGRLIPASAPTHASEGVRQADSAVGPGK